MMMTDEVQSAIAAAAALVTQGVSVAPAAPASTIPQVGDVFRSGVIMGVRTYARRRLRHFIQWCRLGLPTVG
jgi:hypothetical protein